MDHGKSKGKTTIDPGKVEVLKRVSEGHHTFYGSTTACLSRLFLNMVKNNPGYNMRGAKTRLRRTSIWLPIEYVHQTDYPSAARRALRREQSCRAIAFNQAIVERDVFSTPRHELSAHDSRVDSACSPLGLPGADNFSRARKLLLVRPDSPAGDRHQSGRLPSPDNLRVQPHPARGRGQHCLRSIFRAAIAVCSNLCSTNCSTTTPTCYLPTIRLSTARITCRLPFWTRKSGRKCPFITPHGWAGFPLTGRFRSTAGISGT